MAEPAARLYLMTPPVEDAAALAVRLEEACASGAVSAVLVRFTRGDERSIINQIKLLAPAVQENGAALIITAPGPADLATIAGRAGADGIHVTGDHPDLKELRERLKGERALGVGAIRSKDEAMTAGEAGVDYLMFGEPRPDGSLPGLDSVVERVSWWAEIFETPCVVYAPELDAIPGLVATQAEFIALGDAVWNHAEGPAKAVAKAVALIGKAPA